MFLKEFDQTQRVMICKLCYFLIVADHRVKSSEEEILDDIEVALGVPGGLTDEELHKPVDLTVFETPRSRVAVLLQLFAVAYADRQMHPEELDVLRRLARDFRITADTFEEIAVWGRRHAVLFEQATELMQQA